MYSKLNLQVIMVSPKNKLYNLYWFIHYCCFQKVNITLTLIKEPVLKLRRNNFVKEEEIWSIENKNANSIQRRSTEQNAFLNLWYALWIYFYWFKRRAINRFISLLWIHEYTVHKFCQIVKKWNNEALLTYSSHSNVLMHVKVTFGICTHFSHCRELQWPQSLEI